MSKRLRAWVFDGAVDREVWILVWGLGEARFWERQGLGEGS